MSDGCRVVYDAIVIVCCSYTTNAGDTFCLSTAVTRAPKIALMASHGVDDYETACIHLWGLSFCCAGKLWHPNTTNVLSHASAVPRSSSRQWFDPVLGVHIH